MAAADTAAGARDVKIALIARKEKAPPVSRRGLSDRCSRERQTE
jgi:hypothetical protein